MADNIIAEIAKEVLKQALEDAEISLPGCVELYDGKTQRAIIKIMIKRPAGFDLVVDVQVQQIGGDWCVYTEITPGCEGVIMFCSRSIENWIDSGAASSAASPKRFSINDAAFIPGFRSNPNILENIENNGVQLRNKTGEHYLWLKNDGNVYASGKIFQNGNVPVSTDNHIHIDSMGAPTQPANYGLKDD